MKILKYSALTLAVVVGTEVLYKCLKYMFALLHHKNCESLKGDASNHTGKKINTVIFFPDQGILSRSIQEEDIPEEGKSDNTHQYVHKYPHHSKFVKRPSDQTTIPHSPCLKKSTSLIHLVDALDSAKHSLKVCVYVITLQDMLNALLRAKSRGVHVKVILESQMPSEAALGVLRKHNIAVQVSCSSHLMHHKFALVDAPNTHEQVVFPCNRDLTKLNENTYLGRLGAYLASRSSSTQNPVEAESAGPLLLTGSFNWTWTAVINNFENVIISNDLTLINYYNKEFDYLWKKLKNIVS